VKGNLVRLNIGFMQFSPSQAQRAHFHSAPCYKLRKIRFNTRCSVYRNLSRFPDPHSMQPLPPRDYRVKPLHMRPPPLSLPGQRRISRRYFPVLYRPFPSQKEYCQLSDPPDFPEKREPILLIGRKPESISSPFAGPNTGLTDYPGYENIPLSAVAGFVAVFPSYRERSA